MKRTLIVLIALLSIIGLLAACGGQPAAPSAGGSAGTKTAVIGFTASLTGKSNVESIRQKNGLQLWMDQVKTKGGVALTDGNKVTFEAKSYDDESNNERVQELYARLINEDK